MEEYYILCQLAITTAGFAALASLIKPKSQSLDLGYKLNLVRFYIMIEFAVTVAAFGFLPIVLMGFLDEELNFRISSGILFAFAVPLYKYTMNRNKALSGTVNIGGMHTKVTRIFGLTAILILLINAIGLLKPYYSESYLAALYIIFLLSLNLFYRLIINSVKQHPKK